MFMSLRDVIHGAEFKLDVGLYQLYPQVACQRYRQHNLIATIRERLTAFAANFAPKTLAPVLA